MSSVPLSDVCDYSEASTAIEGLSLSNFISTDNMMPNRGGIVNSVNLPPANSCCKFVEDEILISNIRPYFKKIWYATFEGGCSNDVLVLKCKNEKYQPKFVYYCLFQDLFFKHQMTGSKGSKMPRGDQDQIMTFRIPEFEKSYQNKIADYLTLLDEKISLNNRINTELESMAKLIYDYWFVQFDFPDENGKPYKTSGGEMEYNYELKRKIPKGWEVKSLGQIADTGSGGTPLSTRKEYYDNGQIAWINSGELNFPFIVETSNFITEKGLKNSNAKIFPEGTILIAMYGATAGKVSLLSIPASTNQAICAILIREEILKHYLKFALNNLYIYLVTLSSGSARDNLSQEKIRELNFVIPPKKILVAFHKKIQPIFNHIILNLKQNQELIQLRDFLLPMLMNGQVKVK